jgi:hypothetical protein
MPLRGAFQNAGGFALMFGVPDRRRPKPVLRGE